MVEISMIVDLGRLPPRGIVAFAARCARRVQALVRLAPLTAEHVRSVEHAIALAERFAGGEEVADVAAAYAAADAVAEAAASVQTAQLAAQCAYYAARAVDAASEVPYAAATFAQDAGRVAYAAAHAAASEAPDAGYYAEYAARADYERLMSMNRGDLPALGQPVDCREDGPLGALWPEGTPNWLPAAV